MTSSTAWPEGVIARYETHVGGHVDISAIADSTSHTTTCSGCTEKRHSASSDLDTKYYTAEYLTERTLQDARRWAQAHASTCRAVPNPNA